MPDAVCATLPFRRPPPRPVCKWLSTKPGANCFLICYFLSFPLSFNNNNKKGKKEERKKKQKFIPLCISALCNGAKHFSFIIIILVKGTLNNVNAVGKPLGFICMAALSSFSTPGAKQESICRATSLTHWPGRHSIEPLPVGVSEEWKCLT